MKSYSLMCIVVIFSSSVMAQDSKPSREETLAAMKRSVSFFRENAGYQGAYGYRCSDDLTLREGEGRMGPTGGWIEPPGTPFIGMTYLTAWQLTGEAFLLDATLEVADALKRGQLESGGWAGNFDLGEERRKYRYRVDSDSKPKALNVSTLDDEKTQACLFFLMRLDEALEFRNKEIHEVVTYALQKLLAIQYPNGAWPQQFSAPKDFADYPVKKARYPESWSRKYLKADYRHYYTFNDGTISDMMDVMLEAYLVYKDDKFLESALKTGDFMILAQMPEPQPGWAQQYNPAMEPVWARKFEPPAISGGESQGVMQSLMKLYRATGKKRFLEPLPTAIKYYQKSARPDGKMARFYELHTNKPLYFTKDYKLTYSDEDMPTHYGFIVDSKLDRIEKAYKKLAGSPPKEFRPYRRGLPSTKMSYSLAKSAREAISQLDGRGAWSEKGSLKNYKDYSGKIVDSKTFAGRLVNLAAYYGALKNNEKK